MTTPATLTPESVAVLDALGIAAPELVIPALANTLVAEIVAIDGLLGSIDHLLTRSTA